MTSKAEITALIVLTAIYIGGFLLIRFIFHIIHWGSVKAEHVETTMGRVLLWFSIVLIAVAGALQSFLDKPPEWMSLPFPMGLRWVGVVLGFAATILFLLVHIELGDSWSAEVAVKVNHQLKTGGVYRLARHPMYTSLALLGIAIFLTSGGTLLFAAMLFNLYIAARRIGTEERLMLRLFGTQYADYKRTTGAFLPWRFPCCDCGVRLDVADALAEGSEYDRQPALMDDVEQL